uniref:Sodium/hydrogen exchanger n=1 Tax=Plectus sambesii TaxID=2011161 RepID=A0A914VXT0_9BILA
MLTASSLLISVGGGLVGLATGMAQETADDEAYNATAEYLTVVSIDWSHVGTPLTIAVWLLIVTIAKMVFHVNEKFASIFPDSALLIMLGLGVGVVLNLVWPTQVYLHPQLFFLYLLPPIALDAGYFLPNSAFFDNLFTILVYAVIGTIWNVASIGLTLYLLSGWFEAQTSLLDLLLFASLISAVDPVAVLCVFEEIHVNQLLYICVFGESLLNDAVTVVLYHSFGSMTEIGEENLHAKDFVTGGISFFVVSFGGVAIGLFWAVLTGFTTKHTNHLNVVQPLICLLFPYLAYLLAELVHISGILAIVACGLLMKQYLRGNISEKSMVTVKYFLKTLSSSCEAIIFVFLGLSTVSKNHDWNLPFILVTLAACLIARFIGIFALSSVVNRARVKKIGKMDQFIMAYGGLRGAVCYGLVMSLDEEIVPAKLMYVTTTVVVILFTVFIQGLTIKPLVYWLKIKREVEHEKTITEQIFTNTQEHLMAGIESVVGYRGQYWFKSHFDQLNSIYVQPRLMRRPHTSCTKIVDRYEALSVKDAVDHLKKYGSFQGLIASTSKLQLADIEASSSLLLQPSLPQVPQLELDVQTLPRVESLGTIVRETLPPVSPVRRYSRQLLESDVDRFSMQPRVRRLRDRLMSPIEEEADTNTFRLRPSLRLAKRKKVVIKSPPEKRRREAKDSVDREREMDSSALKPRFFISEEQQGDLNLPELDASPGVRLRAAAAPVVVYVEDFDDLSSRMTSNEQRLLLLKPVVEGEDDKAEEESVFEKDA